MWGDDPPHPPPEFPSLALRKSGNSHVGAQRALTAASSLLMVSFASPNSRVVVGS
jgi:hypothetical protein